MLQFGVTLFHIFNNLRLGLFYFGSLASHMQPLGPRLESSGVAKAFPSWLPEGQIEEVNEKSLREN